MRILVVVLRRAEVTRLRQPMRSEASRSRSVLPASSRPITPANSAVPPSAVTLRATLAAPPGMRFSRSKSTTGTGASGEIRLTRPQTNWSSITSPTTHRRAREAEAKSSRRRDFDRSLMRPILGMPGAATNDSFRKRGSWDGGGNQRW